jgi:hypothetical protein
MRTLATWRRILALVGVVTVALVGSGPALGSSRLHRKSDSDGTDQVRPQAGQEKAGAQAGTRAGGAGLHPQRLAEHLGAGGGGAGPGLGGAAVCKKSRRGPPDCVDLEALGDVGGAGAQARSRRRNHHHRRGCAADDPRRQVAADGGNAAQKSRPAACGADGVGQSRGAGAGSGGGAVSSGACRKNDRQSPQPGPAQDRVS